MTGTLTAAPPSRAPSTSLRRRRLRRWSGPHAFAAAAALVAGVANWLVLTGGVATTTVVVAATDLDAGQRVSAADVTARELPAGEPALERLLSDLPDTDMVLVADLAAGTPLRSGDLIPAAGTSASARRMSLPVPLEHAVGGDIVVGDRVDVLATGADGVSTVATALEVVAVADRDDRGFGALGVFHVTVVVDAWEARCLAAALDEATVHVLLATGAVPRLATTCSDRS